MELLFKNTAIQYQDEGKGKAVVLIHGFLENMSMWDAYAQTLAKKYRVIRLDLPGHGSSGCLGYVHTMEEMAEVVKALLDYLKLRKYTIIGHSMGGYLALALAEKYPDNVRGLGLFFSTARDDDDEKKNMRLRAIEAVKQNHALFIHSTIPGLFAEDSLKTHRKKVDAAIAEAAQMSKQGIIAALAGMRERPNREALLHFAPYPVLMVAGKNDPRIPFSESAEQLKAPSISHSYVSPHGHMGHIEDAENCLNAIQDFLKMK